MCATEAFNPGGGPVAPQEQAWQRRKIEERARIAGISLLAPQDQETHDCLSVVERLDRGLGAVPLQMNRARLLQNEWQVPGNAEFSLR
jgi:hypothetical protein